MTHSKFKTNPYNESNKLISSSDIINILKQYNINDLSINNLQLYQRAFIHTSYTKLKDYESFKNPNNCLELFDNSYETLEFIGDSIIGNIIGLYLYNRYYITHNQDEGFLTKLKIRLVNGKQLSEFSKHLKLYNFLIISKNIQEKDNINLLEDIFEAFIGALYLDTNSYELVSKFLINIIETHIDFSDLILNDNNYKDQILRFFQHKFLVHPLYKTTKCEDNHIFECSIYKLNDNNTEIHISSGSGNTKKIAEQSAAKNALIYYQVLNK